MGADAVCRMHFQGKWDDGKVHLDSDHILFRGQSRVKLMFPEIQSVSADDQTLSLGWKGETVVFHLGPAARKWAARIENPRRY